MKLYISQGKLDELASWQPDSTGLIAIIFAKKSEADDSAHLAAFSVSMNCDADEKINIMRTLQNSCMAWNFIFRGNAALIPAFKTYELAQKRFDELYMKNYRHVLSPSSRIVYRIHNNISSTLSSPIKILSPEDSKKFENDLEINKKEEKIFRENLEHFKRAHYHLLARRGRAGFDLP